MRCHLDLPTCPRGQYLGDRYSLGHSVLVQLARAYKPLSGTHSAGQISHLGPALVLLILLKEAMASRLGRLLAGASQFRSSTAQSFQSQQPRRCMSGKCPQLLLEITVETTSQLQELAFGYTLIELSTRRPPWRRSNVRGYHPVSSLEMAFVCW